MIRLLNLGPAKHEKVAIYVVNQRIRMFAELRELLRSGAIRRHHRGQQLRIRSVAAAGSGQRADLFLRNLF